MLDKNSKVRDKNSKMHDENSNSQQLHAQPSSYYKNFFRKHV